MLQPNEIEFIANNCQRSPADIALDARKFPELDIKKMAHQIQARQKLADKLPSWVAKKRSFSRRLFHSNNLHLRARPTLKHP